MHVFLLEARLTWRALGARPTLLLAGAATLALGIGATSTLFSVVDGVLLRPLPWTDSERLVVIHEAHPGRGIERERVAPARFTAWREEVEAFADLTAGRTLRYHPTGDGEPLEIVVGEVLPGYFELLGLPIELGRAFRAGEDEQGQHRVAVLSQAFWRRHFGGDPGVIGRRLWLNGEPFEAVGVAAASRDPFAAPELWVPLENVVWQSRAAHSLDVVARLRPQATLAAARAELAGLARRWAAAYPATDAGWETRLVPLREELVGGVRRALWVLFGAVACVLLVACTNVATLLLGRAAGRRREMALRRAVGAGTFAVLRLVGMESVSLALAGGMLGLGLAAAGVAALRALAPAGLPYVEEIAVDARGLGFTLTVAVVAGILSGLPPLFQSLGQEPGGELREMAAGAGAGRWLPRRLAGLMVAETALSLVLLVGAGLLLKSFWRLADVDSGFDASQVLTADLSLAQAGYQRGPERVRVAAEILERVTGLPGVLSAALVSHLPLSGKGAQFHFWVGGREPTPEGEALSAEVRAVSAAYFRVLGIPLLAGEGFADGGDPAPATVIVNESMVRQFWPGRTRDDVVGEHLGIDGPEGPWMTIVGVVGDVRHFGPERRAVPEFYVPLERLPWPTLTLAVRTAGGDSGPGPAALCGAVWAVAPDLPVSAPRSMAALRADALGRPRFQAILLGSFAALALVLTVVGLYGAMAYSAALRRQEVGVRMSLGATRGDIRALLFGRALKLALLGVALGAAVALALSQVLDRLLYEVSSKDPVVWITVVLALVATVLLASVVPARQASGIDPARALRELG